MSSNFFELIIFVCQSDLFKASGLSIAAGCSTIDLFLSWIKKMLMSMQWCNKVWYISLLPGLTWADVCWVRIPSTTCSCEASLHWWSCAVYFTQSCSKQSQRSSRYFHFEPALEHQLKSWILSNYLHYCLCVPVIHYKTSWVFGMWERSCITVAEVHGIWHSKFCTLIAVHIQSLLSVPSLTILFIINTTW